LATYLTKIGNFIATRFENWARKCNLPTNWVLILVYLY